MPTTQLHLYDSYETPPLTPTNKSQRRSLPPLAASPLDSSALTGTSSSVSDATLTLHRRPVDDPPTPNPLDLDPSAPLIGKVTKSTTSSPSNELHFYVACGKYKHKITVKDLADKQQADKLYADIKTTISRMDECKDYEVDSIDIYNQKVIVKCGADKKEIDLNKIDEDLAKDLQNLFDKILEKALGSDGPACYWPKIYKTAAGPINAGPWFHPNPSSKVKGLKKISAADFLRLNKIAVPKGIDRVNAAEVLITELKKEANGKLKEQQGERDRLRSLPDFDENDPTYKALEASISALVVFVEELNDLDMFALFSILCADFGGSDAEKKTRTNAHVQEIVDILKEGPGGARSLMESDQRYAKQVAVAAQMTDRIDCSMLCKAQQIEPQSDPLEWVIAQYLIRGNRRDAFFAHPRIANLMDATSALEEIVDTASNPPSAAAAPPSGGAVI